VRRLLRIVVFLLLGAGVIAAGGYAYLRRSLPETEGTVRIPGLNAPVEILRDANGVPHIFARSANDTYFALGFVHAQDRLWQMEIDRRIAAGRLAELLGAKALDADRFLRTLGARRAAEANLEHLDAATRRTLEAYAAGVNAFIATNPVLPPEFWILRDGFEPWTPADSIAWTKMMAWDLGGNWRNELLRMRLARTLSNERIAQFLPPYPGDPPPKLPDLHALYASLGADAPRLADEGLRLAALLPSFQADGVGSNNWVVSGAHSATGKPLLANDPHLGLTAPPVWYFAQLDAPGLHVIGATLPGVPGVLLGRNRRIAWGFTNTGPDVQDLYIEKLAGDDRYLAPDGPRPFQRLEETIKVRGEPDQKLTVRITRHGPVVSEALASARGLAPHGYVLALAWTALAEDDASVRALLELGHAHDWPSFLAAGRDFGAPQQNVVYADVDGNIGFVAAGRVPVRRPDNDLKGLAPAPGWLAKYDWTGFIPFDELPQSLNPPSGEIVTANNKIVPPGYRRWITSGWQPPYRAERIDALLARVPEHSVASFERVQADIVSLPARELLPKMLSAKPRSPGAAQALALLGRWDGTMAANRPEPLLFIAWWRALTRALYADELGDAFRANWLPRPVFVAEVLDDKDGAAAWCDDVHTPAVETCGEILSASLEAALADLRKRYGDDMTAWRWGAAHDALHEHRPLGRVPWLARWFDIRVPSPGGPFTVDVGRGDFAVSDEPYANRHAPSLRAIYDLADLDHSLYIHSGGQSGNPLSPDYRGFTGRWVRNEYIPMISDRARLEAGGVRRLTLQPAR
jgi:penicillin amidase